MAKYALNAPVFLAGQILQPGLIITVPDDFVPGRAYDPLDKAAEAAYAKYEDGLPASLKPYVSAEALNIQVEEPEISPDEEVDLSKTLAGAGTVTAQPGLTEKGAAPVPPKK